MAAQTIRAFLFNWAFWFALYGLVLMSRFYKVGGGALIDVEVNIPTGRILSNTVVIALLISIPYTAMDSFLKRRGIYKHSLLEIIINRSLIQIGISLVALTLLAAGNWYYDLPSGRGNSLVDYWFSPAMSILFITALFGNIVLSVYRTLQMKIGEEIFTDLLTGRFSPAREEDRAFLFLDLKSSTTIAESLGHEKYSFFIQDCFRDLHLAVVESNAQVYQYVGDEAVLTWNSRDAIHNAQCLTAFFLFEEHLSARHAYYEREYGVKPVFKGGIHLGKVMTAEVGVVKRDIAYHSDVLNTAARIQGLCNEKNARLLVSRDVLTALGGTSDFVFENKGEVLLRGKNNKVDVFEVLRKNRDRRLVSQGE